jgi:hypothetical protein
MEETKRIRQSKKEKYANERKELILELNNLMGISENNKEVNLHEIKNNNELKKHLEECDKKIKKYFKCGSWNYYIKKSLGEESPIIGLIRAIYRDEDYIFTTKDKVIDIDGKKIKTTNYYVIKIEKNY